MLLIGLTDIHGKDENIDKISNILAKADAVIISGDITHFGREKNAKKVIENIKMFNSNIYAVSGNCDYSGVDKYLTENMFNINGSSKSFKGYTFVGLGGSLPCPGRTPNEYTEDELAAVLLSSVSGVPSDANLILVSHQPPVDTLNDEVRDGMHVGSKAVRSFIEEYQPLICFTGHIHEGIGIDSIGNTRLANPGPLWYGKYTRAELSDGRINKFEICDIRSLPD
ncbi:MAG: metallophosphoesterase family protein [Bacteroidales bacterium]|nr:MAG: metallophosphoesterase family protein [Bacteroidales bacterium]